VTSGDNRRAELEAEREAILARVRGGAAKDGGKARAPRGRRRPGVGWWSCIKAWQATATWAALSPRGAQVFVTVLGHCRKYQKGAKGKTVYRYSGNRGKLADACGCSASTITEALAELEQRGLVKRSQRTRHQGGAFVSSVHVWPQWPGPASESLPGMGAAAENQAPTESGPS